MKLIKKLFVLFIFIFIYLLFASKFSLKFPLSYFNYYNYLADAFLQGKTYLTKLPDDPLIYSMSIYHAPLDLSIFNNRLYLYWGPMPAVLLMPFIKIFGLNISDYFYNALVGGVNCFIFYLLINQLIISKLVNIPARKKSFLIIFFAFGTVHFTLSLFGTVWWSAHVFALFFFLISLYFILKYYNLSQTSYLIASAVFFSFSFLTKQNLLLTIIFFLVVIYKKNLQFKAFIKKAGVFIIILLFFLFIYFYYNYLRFNNPFETGFIFQNINLKHLKLVEQFGFFNILYIPKNLYYWLINPLEFNFTFPFIVPNKYLEGNGIFFTSPLFILLLLKIKNIKIAFQKQKLFLGSILISLILMLWPAIIDYGTGGDQIAPRFLSEALPFLLILLSPTLNLKKRYPYFLLFCAITIQLLSWFYWSSHMKVR